MLAADKAVIQARSGVGHLTVLFLIFLVLRLVGVINWPWWVVFMPLYIMPVLFIGLITVLFLIGMLFGGRK